MTAEIPTPDDFGKVVVTALLRAREAAGLTEAQMVERLSPFQSRHSTGAQRWHDWTHKPQSVGARTLLALPHVSGISLWDLLGEEEPEIVKVRRRVERLEQAAGLTPE